MQLRFAECCVKVHLCTLQYNFLYINLEWLGKKDGLFIILENLLSLLFVVKQRIWQAYIYLSWITSR